MDYIVKSKILIAECTFFVDEHSERADAGRHMHIDEFVEMISNLDNEHIVITHLTQRTRLSEIRSILKKKLGQDRYRKVLLLMDGRGRNRR